MGKRANLVKANQTPLKQNLNVLFTDHYRRYHYGTGYCAFDTVACFVFHLFPISVTDAAIIASLSIISLM